MVRPCLLQGVLLLMALLQPSSQAYAGSSTECNDRTFRRNTLKLIKEMPFSGLFADLKKQAVFEASGVARVRGKMFVVFDSSMSIGMLGDEHFRFRDSSNALIGERGQESQFEGIAYVPENDTFLLLQEALSSDTAFKPSVLTAKLHDDLSSYDIVSQCQVDFELTHENKGWESILYVSRGEYLLGLCEGNHCMGGKMGRDTGNGRVVASQLDVLADGSCTWVPVRTIEVPSDANFIDYAAMAYSYKLGKLAILSQENAAVWVGDFDIDTLEFGDSPGQVFHLPRDNHCERIYCNVEGIQWIDDYRLVLTSDKAKSTQPFWCDAKDQSVHIFSLPPTWQPAEGSHLKAPEETHWSSSFS